MKYSTAEQSKIIRAIQNQESVCIQAYAGCGKTTTFVRGALALSRDEPKLSKIALAFNVRIKDELIKRLDGTEWRVKTFNGLGHTTLMANRKLWNDGRLTLNANKNSDLVHDLLSRDSVSQMFQTEFPKSISFLRAHGGMACLSPFLVKAMEFCKVYGIRPIDVMKLKLDDFLSEIATTAEIDNPFEKRQVSVDAGARILKALLDANVQIARNSGVIDYSDQIYLATMFCPNPGPSWNTVAVDEVQDLSKLNQIQVLRACRKQLVFVGDKWQCQPKGTKVLTPDGVWRKIEDLRAGDAFTSYSWRGGGLRGQYTKRTHFKRLSNGEKSTERLKFVVPRIKAVAKRKYNGPMLKITTKCGVSSRCTPEHIWPVKSAKEHFYYVYLMQKGKYIRIGYTANPSQRCRAERADKLWILKYFKNRADAAFYENIMSSKYGIPQIVFSAWRESRHRAITMSEKDVKKWMKKKQEMLDSAWKFIGRNTDKLEEVLTAHGRKEEFPYYSSEVYDRLSWNINVSGSKVAYIRACNLMPGVHLVCTPLDRDRDKNTQKSKWKHFDLTSRRYKGYVYSLDCGKLWDTSKVYISDGLLTHNCLYGFRGALENSMKDLQVDFEKKSGKPMTNLTLSKTFRCPHVVVQRQKRIVAVKKFCADSKNSNGDVQIPFVTREESGKYYWTVKGILRKLRRLEAKRSFIISAHNAPLFVFLTLGLKERLDHSSFSLAGQLPSLSQFISAGDKSQGLGFERMSAAQKALRFFMFSMDMRPAEARDLLATFYTSDSTTGYSKAALTCTTVHSCKGLEAEAVFLLEPQILCDEGNVRYVAETRSSNFLASINLVHYYSSKPNHLLDRYRESMSSDKVKLGIKPDELVEAQVKALPKQFAMDNRNHPLHSSVKPADWKLVT